jgi:hypothetical protein
MRQDKELELHSDSIGMKRLQGMIAQKHNDHAHDFLFAHDFSGKAVPTFPDRAPGGLWR